MKNFLPLLFIVSVIGAVRADIASTKYVDDRAYVLPMATASTLGGVKIGDNINVEDGTIFVPVASTEYIDENFGEYYDFSYGVVSGNVTTDPGNDLGFLNGVLNIPVVDPNVYTASVSEVPGMVYVSPIPWELEMDGEPSRGFLDSVPTVEHMRAALRDKMSLTFIDEDGMPATVRDIITVDDYGTAGPTEPGAGLSVAGDGTLSVSPATKSSLGGVKIGNNINVDKGSISVPSATAETSGVSKWGQVPVKNDGGSWDDSPAQIWIE